MEKINELRYFIYYLKGKKIYSLFKNNLNAKSYNVLANRAYSNDFYGIINDVFVWEETPQKGHFWVQIYFEWNELLAKLRGTK